MRKNLYWLTVKWSKHRATRSSLTPIRKMWRSLSLGTPLGMVVSIDSVSQLLDLHLRATTHTDIILRARGLGIPTRVIHNASIMNAVGASGLQLYNFGQTVSLVFFTETWKPDSFYDRVKENSILGMHTLILLDIKVKEQSEENLARLIPLRTMLRKCVISFSFQGSKDL